MPPPQPEISAAPVKAATFAKPAFLMKGRTSGNSGTSGGSGINYGEPKPAENGLRTSIGEANLPSSNSLQASVAPALGQGLSFSEKYKLNAAPQPNPSIPVLGGGTPALVPQGTNSSIADPIRPSLASNVSGSRFGRGESIGSQPPVATENQPPAKR